MGLDNIDLVTCDMNEFCRRETGFDRVVSVEMFEHMRNWRQLFARVHDWLAPGGRFFMHVFVGIELKAAGLTVSANGGRVNPVRVSVAADEVGSLA